MKRTVQDSIVYPLSIMLLTLFMLTYCESVKAAAPETIFAQLSSSSETHAIVIVKKLFKYDTSSEIERTRHINESVGGYSKRIVGILAAKYLEIGNILVYAGIQASEAREKDKGLLVFEYSEYPGNRYSAFGYGENQGWAITYLLSYYEPNANKPQWQKTVTATNSPSVSSMLGFYSDAMENMVAKFSESSISRDKIRGE